VHTYELKPGKERIFEILEGLTAKTWKRDRNCLIEMAKELQ
jgi:hypothetical protein